MSHQGKSLKAFIYSTFIGLQEQLNGSLYNFMWNKGEGPATG